MFFQSCRGLGGPARCWRRGYLCRVFPLRIYTPTALFTVCRPLTPFMEVKYFFYSCFFLKSHDQVQGVPLYCRKNNNNSTIGPPCIMLLHMHPHHNLRTFRYQALLSALCPPTVAVVSTHPQYQSRSSGHTECRPPPPAYHPPLRRGAHVKGKTCQLQQWFILLHLITAITMVGNSTPHRLEPTSPLSLLGSVSQPRVYEHTLLYLPQLLSLEGDSSPEPLT